MKFTQNGLGIPATFPRAAVASSSRMQNRLIISRGVHGMGGRWLVNGSGQGIVVIDLEPPQHAYVLGIPVRLRQLVVSLEDPDGLRSVLGR